MGSRLVPPFLHLPYSNRPRPIPAPFGPPARGGPKGGSQSRRRSFVRGPLLSFDASAAAAAAASQAWIRRRGRRGGGLFPPPLPRWVVVPCFLSLKAIGPLVSSSRRPLPLR